METISFVLGMASVVVVAIAIVAVVALFKVVRLNKRLIELENNQYTEIQHIYNNIEQHSIMDNRRIDGEIDRVNIIADNVYKTMDSRFDKLETKLMDTIKNGCEPVKEIKNK